MKIKKRTLIEWGVILGIFGILYFTGLHTAVMGKIQQGILATGIIKPDVSNGESSRAKPEASYDMVLESSTGEQLDLKAMKDKVIFINFWATWCPPCIAEMPGINSLYKEMASDDIRFLMISRDKNFEKARKFIDKKEFSFPVYKLKTQIPQVYQSRSIPSTFVVSKDGKIVMKHQGMAKYNNKEMRDFLRGLI